MFEQLVYTFEPSGIATIRLDRPQVYNAINEQIGQELIAALERAAADERVRAVVLTGTGKAFCSGQDLKEAASQVQRSLSDSLTKRYNPIIRLMRKMPKPIIGQINGIAAGAGCSLALACDYIIAGEGAAFCQIFINIGLVPDSGSSFFMAQRVGMAKAFELCSLADKVPAAEALRIGLINQVCADEDLAEETLKIALRYAQAPTLAIGYIKHMLNQALVSPLDYMLEQEVDFQQKAAQSSDYLEGTRAFAQKRKPNFEGK